MNIWKSSEKCLLMIWVGKMPTVCIEIYKLLARQICLKPSRVVYLPLLRCWNHHCHPGSVQPLRGEGRHQPQLHHLPRPRRSGQVRKFWIFAVTMDWTGSKISYFNFNLKTMDRFKNFNFNVIYAQVCRKKINKWGSCRTPKADKSI